MSAKNHWNNIWRKKEKNSQDFISFQTQLF